MSEDLNIFLNKKILIYGLGKSGLSSYRFLNKKNNVFLYDDFLFNIRNAEIKKKIINYKNVHKFNFDSIILSPGIDINKCKLSKYLKKNHNKIYSDLDVFSKFYKNDCITITGTNGKSTTCQILYDVLLSQKYNVKLVGNIGNPILSVKDVKRNTIFVVEASSYQLEYSKIFKSKYAAILNLSPDHLERHKSFNRYIKAKFRLLESQSKGSLAFVNKNDYKIQKILKSGFFKCKIINVDNKKTNKFLKGISNHFFSTDSNIENLSFVLEISKALKLKKNLLKKTIQKYKGLKYRQQIVFKKKYLTIINDSKSTSLSSSIGLLTSNTNIYWLLGGIPKKGDKFFLKKKYFKNIKAYIYGKNKNFFNKTLKSKIEYENFQSLKGALKRIFKIIKKQKLIHKTILFSPCAASFDSFKNFEDRGFYFNKLIKKYLNGI